MRVILEKAEVLTLLGGALGYDFKEGDVEIITDPFEVHIKNVRVAELAAPKKPQGQVQEPRQTSVVPQQLEDSLNLDEVLADSAALAAGLPSTEIDPDTRGINDFARKLYLGETEDPPGEDYTGEIPR